MNNMYAVKGVCGAQRLGDHAAESKRQRLPAVQALLARLLTRMHAPGHPLLLRRRRQAVIAKVPDQLFLLRLPRPLL